MTIAEPLPILWPDDSPRARRDDPVTSHEAADTTDTAGSRLAVRRILEASSKPLADHEIEKVHRTLTSTPYTGQRLRTARHELVQFGVIEAAGTTRTPTGRRTRTWRLVGRTT